MKERSAEYTKGSLSLLGTIAMGTGVMIGAGIFALTGQVAELQERNPGNRCVRHLSCSCRGYLK